MVLITLTMGQVDLDVMKDIMAEMKMEMMEEMKMEMMVGMKMMADMKMELNQRLDYTEAELAASTDKTNVFERRMNECLSMTHGKLAETEVELAATKDDLAITKAKTDDLEREVSILRAPPFIHACGSNTNLLYFQDQIIPYTSLLYSSTNTEGGGLDISTGVFTAPHGGSYTVYWDTSAYLVHGCSVYIHLQKNGETIQESQHTSVYYGPSEYVYDQGKFLSIYIVTVYYVLGGRTMVVYLAIGDTLQLYRDGGTGDIAYTTFCVSLTTFDIV